MNLHFMEITCHSIHFVYGSLTLTDPLVASAHLRVIPPQSHNLGIMGGRNETPRGLVVMDVSYVDRQ